MCTVYICLCVPVCLITFTSTIYYIHVCAMIINEYILYIVLIKRGKIQLVGEDRKKWYGDRLHLIHDAPPLYNHLKYLRILHFILKHQN